MAHSTGFVQRVFDFFSERPERTPPPVLPATESNGGAQVLPDSRRSVVLAGQVVPYELVRQKRKTIGMQVHEGRLRVSASNRVSLRQIQSVLVEKQLWILRQLQATQTRALRQKAHDVTIQEGCQLPWLGARVTLHFQAEALSNAPQNGGLWTLSQGGDALSVVQAFDQQARHVGGEFDLHLQAKGLAKHRHARTQQVLREQAKALFAHRLAHHAQAFGVQPQGFKLSSAKTRWGSASANGWLHLNWHLIHFEPDLIDYVVAHELCHLLHMDHSPAYWERFSRVMPDCLSRRKRLAQQITPQLLMPLESP